MSLTGYRAKKSLGQHFLKNRQILHRLVRAGNFQADETVIEIGAGTGNLTQELLKTGAKIIALEKDPELCRFLEERFASQNNFRLVAGDVLRFDPSVEVKTTHYKVCGNIPYYLTGKILALLLEQWPKPEKIILMVQKEVAERLTASPPRLTLLGTLNQLLAEIRILFFLSRKEFSPPPRVDSGVIEIIPYPHNVFQANPGLKSFIKLGFSQPRKYLISVLSAKLGKEKIFLQEKFLQLGLNPQLRAGELQPTQWLQLYSALNH